MLEKHLRRQQITFEKRCPGETDCRDFRKSAGKTREEKEENACTNCPMFKTKYNHSASDEDIWQFVGSIEKLRNEQRAGEVMNLNQLSYFERQGLILWHKIESEIDAEFKAQSAMMFQALLVRQ